MKKGSCIGTKFGKWKKCFIKNNITRNIDPPRGAIKTLITLMQRAIAEEYAHLGAKLKLASIVLAKTRPASTPKNPKGGVVGLNMKQMEQRCVSLLRTGVGIRLMR